MTPSVVALIPARAGSKRVPAKNIRPLNGVPLIAYTVKAALESDIFTGVFVSTDSAEYCAIAERYGAQVIQRPEQFAGDVSPDFEWVRHAVDLVSAGDDAFSILRPTSPFRTAETIRRAWVQFTAEPSSYDSLRAVERARQHPQKMWVRNGGQIIPYNPMMIHANGVQQPAHSVPTQLLPEVLVQNASLEIAWTKTLQAGNISGSRVMPFLTTGYEGFDLNVEDDWIMAEEIVRRGLAVLPEIPGAKVPKKRGRPKKGAA